MLAEERVPVSRRGLLDEVEGDVLEDGALGRHLGEELVHPRWSMKYLRCARRSRVSLRNLGFAVSLSSAADSAVALASKAPASARVIAAFASGPKDMFAKRLSSFGDQATSAGIKSCKASLVSGP